MSGKFGILYPVLLLEVLPGDVVTDQMTCFMRFAPMLAPIMHRIDVTTHFFYVPNRIVTDHWELFITGGQEGVDAPVLPFLDPLTMITSGYETMMRKGTLWDYLGLPVLEGAAPGIGSEVQISVLPFRACAKVWNDWYRDPNFDEEMDLNLDLQGNVTEATGDNFLYLLRNRMWEKDYLTSALPFAQRGAEVLMPLSGLADTFIDKNTGLPITGVNRFFGNDSLLGSGLATNFNPVTSFGRAALLFENSSTSINDFRRAIAIQGWLEANARGGGRYVDQIKSHFGVTVPDYRLQRAEYLGGGKQPVTISQVLSTTDTATVPVGDMAGHGVSVGKSNRFSYRCQEHGHIVAFMSVVPRTAYSQGIDRSWTRTDKYDYAWAELAKLGEQTILSREAFFSFDNTQDAANNATFGYIPRYAEYKFKNDRIAGDFRDNLGFWHLGRNFVARPTLDQLFTTMYENNTADEETYRRIFAVTDGTDYLWCQLFHKLKAQRPLPYFGVPKIL